MHKRHLHIYDVFTEECDFDNMLFANLCVTVAQLRKLRQSIVVLSNLSGKKQNLKMERELSLAIHQVSISDEENIFTLLLSFTTILLNLVTYMIGNIAQEMSSISGLTDIKMVPVIPLIHGIGKC